MCGGKTLHVAVIYFEPHREVGAALSGRHLLIAVPLTVRIWPQRYPNFYHGMLSIETPREFLFQHYSLNSTCEGSLNCVCFFLPVFFHNFCSC